MFRDTIAWYDNRQIRSLIFSDKWFLATKLKKISGTILNTGLFHYSELGNIRAIKFLISKGADIHYGDECAFSVACEKGHLSVVKFLISKGVNVKVHNGYPLWLAVSGGYLHLVKYLVSKGAGVHVGLLGWARNISVYNFLLSIHSETRK